MAEKKPGATNAPELDAAVYDTDPWEMVNIKLQRDRKSGKGVYVNVNNHNYFIPRGELVAVPRFIAETLEHSADQDENTAQMIERLGVRANF